MANPDLIRLKGKLQALMAPDKDGNLRPFVCEGNPFDCHIFLVGLNPVTEIGNYWGYWDDSYGFHKSKWYRAYTHKKIEQGGKITPTRRNLEIIESEVLPYNCLETDIYSKPTKKLRDLPKSERRTEIFDCLVDEIKPRVMLVYGGEAVDHLQRKCGVALPHNTLTEVTLNGLEVAVYAGWHLSFGWSKERAAKVGQMLREKISCNEHR